MVRGALRGPVEWVTAAKQQQPSLFGRRRGGVLWMGGGVCLLFHKQKQ